MLPMLHEFQASYPIAHKLSKYSNRAGEELRGLAPVVLLPSVVTHRGSAAPIEKSRVVSVLMEQLAAYQACLDHGSGNAVAQSGFR